MARLTRNALILRYLVGVAPGVGHTKLLKFAYLADLEARRYLGKPISSFRYQRYTHGPFDSSFYAAKDELISGGFVTTSVTWVGSYQGNCLQPTPSPVEYDFSVGEAEVLRYVAESYMSLTARQLCDDIVYETEPMKDVQMMDELPMDKVERRADTPFQFDFERMLQSEQSAGAGRTRPLKTALNELRARNHR
jgi:hypothetical protein